MDHGVRVRSPTYEATIIYMYLYCNDLNAA